MYLRRTETLHAYFLRFITSNFHQSKSIKQNAYFILSILEGSTKEFSEHNELATTSICINVYVSF